jgi:hypothetical protein
MAWLNGRRLPGALGIVAVVLLSIAATGCLTTVGGSGEKDPAWSPNGALLAYVRYEIGRDDCESSIWLRQAEGGADSKIIADAENRTGRPTASGLRSYGSSTKGWASVGAGSQSRTPTVRTSGASCPLERSTPTSPA